MDLSEIRKLVKLMQQAELSELEIDDTKAGLRVHLRRGEAQAGDGSGGAPVAPMAPLLQVLPGQGAPAPAPAAAGSAPAAAGTPEPEGLPPGATVFPSPMVGTFYRSPSPDADSFVEVGSKVGEDNVLCIIEAMKVMNEIKAERRAEVLEILVENGEPVEFGQPLFLLKNL